MSQLEIALHMLDSSQVKNYKLHPIILILCRFQMGHAWIAIYAVSLENALEWGKSHLWSFKLEMGTHFSELLAQFLFVGSNCWWCHLHSLVEVMMQDKIHYWSLWSCIFTLQIGFHLMWILKKANEGKEVTFPDRKIDIGNKQCMTGETKFNRKENEDK